MPENTVILSLVPALSRARGSKRALSGHHEAPQGS